jgi:hypothetical protein
MISIPKPVGFCAMLSHTKRLAETVMLPTEVEKAWQPIVERPSSPQEGEKPGKTMLTRL